MKNHPIDSLLNQIQTTYTAIFNTPLIPKVQTKEFNLDQLLMQRFSPRELKVIQSSSLLRDKGLQKARQGELVLARQFFDEARKQISLSMLSAEALLFTQDFLYPAEAYWHYCLGEYDEATKKIYQALQMATQLIDVYGYETLDLQRLQFIHNLIRIKIQENEKEEAILMANHSLAYLAGNFEAWPFSQFIRTTLPASYDFIMAYPFFYQIVSEVALILVNYSPAEASSLFALINQENFSHIDEYQACCYWFQIKQHFLYGETELFLQKADKFLAQYRTTAPILWFVVLYDINQLCGQLGTKLAIEMQADIIQKLSNSPNIPKPLKYALLPQPTL